MTASIIIEPQTKTVWEGPFPVGLITPRPVAGIGLIVTDPMSPFEPGIHPWFFEPFGLQLGRMVIHDPQLPLAAVERLITWIRATMVLNGATSIITHPRNYHR